MKAPTTPLLFVSLLLATMSFVHATEAAKPNIVFVLFDDLGYGQQSACISTASSEARGCR